MSTLQLHTKSLTLIPNSLEETRALVAALSPEEREQVSPAWLAQLEAATTADPWTHGFSLRNGESGRVVGSAAFKGPPDSDGVVEIAYAVDPDYRGRGYATEAAEALTAFAFDTGRVRVVRAHTLPEVNASGRVLTKCGFQNLGEVVDPEDGPVWRWEKVLPC